MKKLLMLFMMTAPFTGLQAQDVIFKKNGDEIQAKVLKVTESEIEYAKWSNPKGPTYVLSLGNVFMVKYENGEKDVFADQDAPQTSQPSQAAAEKTSGKKSFGEKSSGGIAAPADNNDALIRSYNDHETSFVVEKQTNRKAYDWIGILGVDASSVMSSAELEIAIVQTDGCLLHGTYMNPWPFNGHFYLELHNKTDHTLYVDLGNTFRVDGNGNSKVYYDTTQTSVNHGAGGSAGLNVGVVSNFFGDGGTVGTPANGINFSSGKYNSSSKTYIKQRVMAIPPHGKAVLEQCEWEHVKGVALWKEENNVYKSYCEGFNYEYANIPVKKGELQHYGFDDSPQKYRYRITYSSDEAFAECEALTLNVYVKDLLGGQSVYDFKRRKDLRNDGEKVIVVGGEINPFL